MELRELHNYTQNEIDKTDARVSLLVHDFTKDETLLSFGADRKVVSASTIKTPIMLTALDLVQRGKLSLEQRVAVPLSEILDDTAVFDMGQKDATLEELLTWMIINSDNTSTNVLIEFLGTIAINSYCGTLGLKDTVVERKMLDWGAIKAGRNNYTSADDQLIVFSKLYHASVLTPELCRLALSILKRQRDFGLALRYLCSADITFAHKTGGLDYLEHDTGIFYLPGHDYYFGCFVTDSMSETDENPVAKRLIGRLSKAVYDFYK
jgi:beta-lactamase class A